MIKVIFVANRHPTNRSEADFYRYWGETHGPVYYAKVPGVRRYVQHHTLAEARSGPLPPTHDGASIAWFDDVDSHAHSFTTPESAAVGQDDRQLFDRASEWPHHQRRAYVVAAERVVVDGPTTPTMVKLVATAARLPGLSLAEFSRHWWEVHGPLGARLPGLRRYVQNHALPAALTLRGGLTHDGWAELWFDDLAALHAAVASPAWQRLRADGATLFARPQAVVIGRERVIVG